MLAFMVFSLVWVGEIFCIVRVRGSPSAAMRKFPPLFLMLFLLFLLYVYSFPLGFTYVAFVTWVHFFLPPPLFPCVFGHQFTRIHSVGLFCRSLFLFLLQVSFMSHRFSPSFSLFLFLHIYIHIYIYIYIYVYISIYGCIYIYIYLCVYIYIYIYTSVYVFIYTFICTYMYIYVCTYIYVQCIHTHTYKYICT